MTAIKTGNAVLTVFNEGRVRVDVCPSVKELLQRAFSQSPLEGVWGSREHLAALHETRDLLERVIARIAADAGARK